MTQAPGGLFAERKQLGADLRTRREASKLSSRGLAGRLGISQSQVSKIERGEANPKPDLVRTWAEATGATRAEGASLAARAEALRSHAISWRKAFRNSALFGQRDVQELEARAATISYYQPLLIPGPLQTPDYTFGVFRAGAPPDTDPSEIAAAVAARQDRQQPILYDPSKRIRFILGEPALRWRFGPASVQLAQVDRLRVVATSMHVQLGILRLDTPLPVWHTHGFNLYEDLADDDPVVLVETRTAGVSVSDPDDVAVFRRTWDALQVVAIAGQELSQLLDQTIEDLRGIAAAE